MAEISVVVATYGDESWEALAGERAIPSAEGQAPVIHVHGETLAASRNAGLAQAETEFVCFLDADDELEPGYIEALAAGSADLRCPAIRQVRDGRPRRPFVPKVFRHEHDCRPECLLVGNWLVIGTAVRAELLRSVGGWEEWPWSEDWAAWLRCYRAGGTVEAIPEAIYRAHVRDGSRNRIPTRARLHWHHEIERAILPEELWVLP